MAFLKKIPVIITLIYFRDTEMKLYALLDGPPSIAVRMVFKALDLSYELVGMDYKRGEHLKGHYAQVKFECSL